MPQKQNCRPPRFKEVLNMHLVDVDAVDWSKCPTEVLDMTSIGNVKQFLHQQPYFIGVAITNSQNPNVRSAASITAMHFSQALMSMYPLIVEVIKEQQSKGEQK
jgi:hypothetical protein